MLLVTWHWLHGRRATARAVMATAAAAAAAAAAALLLLCSLAVLPLQLRAISAASAVARPSDECATFYENATRRGSTFRSGSDFGAKGDGRTDDTAAIQVSCVVVQISAVILYVRLAGSQEKQEDWRLAHVSTRYSLLATHSLVATVSCVFTLIAFAVAVLAVVQAAINHARGEINAKANAVVYLPPGEYLISATLILWFSTALVGNSRCPPTIKLKDYSWTTPCATAAAGGKSGSLICKPMIATTTGFNQRMTGPQGRCYNNSGVGCCSGCLNDNCHFFTSIRHVNFDLGRGNIGASAIHWMCVPNQSLLAQVPILI
eukprot:COSAG05_NODE_1223_length_5468_cov_31.139877_6_plen_318_part_00